MKLASLSWPFVQKTCPVVRPVGMAVPVVVLGGMWWVPALLEVEC